MPEATNSKPTVLVVDDTPENLDVLSNLLRDSYRVRLATSGAKALQLAFDAPPDLVLLDIMMPGMDGYEVLERLKADPRTQTTPVIFLTAMSRPEDEERGLLLGAVDYITKPISPPIALARVATHLHLKVVADVLRDKAAYLEAEVVRRTRDMRSIQEVTLVALASLAETRDGTTSAHILRTQNYVRSLCMELRHAGSPAAALDERTVDLIVQSVPLHDIGMVTVPEAILRKPGRLTEQEFNQVKRHARVGHDALDASQQRLAVDAAFLRCAKDIVLSHHERFDGSGYPDGLRGSDIPLSARLMALADVYDALVTPRVYKQAVSHDEAVATIFAASGTLFDPVVVAAFERRRDDFRAIAERYVDGDSD
jgi:putative two-component system response regulator